MTHHLIICCIIMHLPGKLCATKLKENLSTTVSVVNSNRNHCLFHALCKETGTKPTILFFHNEMRWLNDYSCFWTAGRSKLLCNHSNTLV